MVTEQKVSAKKVPQSNKTVTGEEKKYTPSIKQQFCLQSFFLDKTDRPKNRFLILPGTGK